MNSWKKYNLFIGTISGVLSFICIVYLQVSPILLLPGAFTIGVCYKCIKNIIVGPPKLEKKKIKQKAR